MRLFLKYLIFDPNVCSSSLSGNRWIDCSTFRQYLPSSNLSRLFTNCTIWKEYLTRPEEGFCFLANKSLCICGQEKKLGLER